MLLPWLLCFKIVTIMELNKHINKYNIIKGTLKVENNLLFNSKQEIDLKEIEVYINNKKVQIKKDGYKFKFNINNYKY